MGMSRWVPHHDLQHCSRPCVGEHHSGNMLETSRRSLRGDELRRLNHFPISLPEARKPNKNRRRHPLKKIQKETAFDIPCWKKKRVWRRNARWPDLIPPRFKTNPKMCFKSFKTLQASLSGTYPITAILAFTVHLLIQPASDSAGVGARRSCRQKPFYLFWWSVFCR